MAFDISSIGGSLMNWALMPLFWLVIIIFFVLAILGTLYIKKKRKLKYNVIEIVDRGNNDVEINTDLKAGWFGKRQYLKGLWCTGEEVLTTNLGDKILYFSSEDYKIVNGKKGIVCFRDPVRQDILVPISRTSIKNKELLAAIAPADYTDVAINIINDAVAETTDWKDKMIQLGSWALVVIFSLVAIIIISFVVSNYKQQ